MKQLRRVVTFALVVFLIGVPAVALAQGASGSGSMTSGAQDKAKDKATDKTTDGSSAPSASPGTRSGPAGKASPMTPASVEDCKNNGWQTLGFRSEAECTAKVKK
jgi:hypothetical protein